MTEHQPQGPALLCYDGSNGAAYAIASAGLLLAPRPATVLIVREPTELWEHWDPATIIDAEIAKLTPLARELDEIADSLANEHLTRGVQLASDAGFDAHGQLGHGKPWRVICEAAMELDSAVIVLGARGRSRVQSALLGSVSVAVSNHAERPVLIVHSTTRNGDPVAPRQD
jgi:nucleotide-binding universal stress UspA family protein